MTEEVNIILPPSNIYAIIYECPHCKRTIKIKGGFIPETFVCVGCRNKLTAEDFFKEQDKE